MFKGILSLALLISIGASGQQTKTPVRQGLANKTCPADHRFESAESNAFQPEEERAQKRIHPNESQLRAGFNEMIIGNTQYDLQTNASVQNRFIRSGSDLLAIWTQSLQVSPFSDRGTGLNTSSDGGGSWNDIPLDRLESIRTGWPSLLETGDGRQVVICHEFPLQLYMLHRDDGVDDWTESYIDTSVPQGVSWARAVSGGADGNSIHMIYLTMPSGNQSVDPPLDYEGMDAAILYSRSTDQGDTWDIHEVMLEGMNAESFLGFSPDAYAIHARGDKIAFAVFNDFADSFVMVSEDNGDTWSQSILFDFPVDLYTGDDELIDLDEDEVADIVTSSDRCGAVFIDQDMHVHVSYGLMNYQDEVLADDGAFVYYPFTDGLAYWNDTMDENSWMDIAFSLDLDESGELELTSDFTQYGVMGLTAMPQFAQDDAGNLFLTYSSIVETHATGNQNFRHVYFMKSEDGGNSWSDPVDGTPDEEFFGYECIYPTLVPNADDRLHLIYQRDFEPGLHVIGEQDAVDLNDIMYLWVTTDLDFTGIEQVQIAFDIYPNPVSDRIWLDVDATIELFSITDINGRVVAGGNLAGEGSGIDIRHMKNGAYVLSLATDKGIARKQFIKQ